MAVWLSKKGSLIEDFLPQYQDGGPVVIKDEEYWHGIRTSRAELDY